MHAKTVVEQELVGLFFWLVLYTSGSLYASPLTILEMSKLSATILHREKYLAVPEDEVFFTASTLTLYLWYTPWVNENGGYF